MAVAGRAISREWDLWLKLEQMQVTGSFKARGAFNFLLQAEPTTGVSGASGGNFGKALAYASAALGIDATVFVPDSSPVEKTGQIARYGAEVRLVPGFYPDALAESLAFARETGARTAHAYDDPAVMAGQGTVGLEILEQVDAVTTVMVPVGGGGLIGGIASLMRGSTQVIGVETDACPTLYKARERGAPTEVEVGGIAASALGARITGDIPWTANQWIADSVLVPDESASSAQRWLWEEFRLWVEPAAAAPLAALRDGAVVPAPGDAVVVVLSGANVALA